MVAAGRGGLACGDAAGAERIGHDLRQPRHSCHAVDRAALSVSVDDIADKELCDPTDALRRARLGEPIALSLARRPEQTTIQDVGTRQRDEERRPAGGDFERSTATSPGGPYPAYYRTPRGSRWSSSFWRQCFAVKTAVQCLLYSSRPAFSDPRRSRQVSAIDPLSGSVSGLATTGHGVGRRAQAPNSAIGERETD